MGTDFGGVVALTPAVAWLLLAVAGVRLTGLRLLAVAGSRRSTRSSTPRSIARP